MDNVIHYITTAVARTGAQLLVVFGVVFALAVVLWFVSQGIRGTVSSRIGMVYYYLVATWWRLASSAMRRDMHWDVC